MIPLTSLWLPVLLSAVFVFIASSVIHMLFKYHKRDYGRLKDETAFRDAVRPLAIPPGDYMVPCGEPGENMHSEAFAERMKEGPNMHMTVFPNEPFNMGKPLMQWFVYCLVVAGFAAWVAGRTLAPGTEYLQVFCLVAVVAFAGFALALLQNSIWWGRNWGTTARGMFDGLVYAALTAGTFGWLWPAGA